MRGFPGARGEIPDWAGNLSRLIVVSEAIDGVGHDAVEAEDGTEAAIGHPGFLENALGRNILGEDHGADLGQAEHRRSRIGSRRA